MITEQPDLFGDSGQGGKPDLQNYGLDKMKDGRPFLPGVVYEEAYPQINDYYKLEKLAVNCSRCRLRATCKQVVFGAGKLDADLMLIGEGPGKDEDEQGYPFVGRAGQLLDKILAAAEIPRPEVYISNVVKCRPPGNRLPNPDEVAQCRNYLEAQIRMIRPRIIICLGAMASQSVISPRARITDIRGKWFTRQGIKIMPVFHPAALLRNESYKRPTWEDFKKIRDEYKQLTD